MVVVVVVLLLLVVVVVVVVVGAAAVVAVTTRVSDYDCFKIYFRNVRCAISVSLLCCPKCH
jgi:hypothetical protein